MTRPVSHRLGLAALVGIIAAGFAAPAAGATELGVVQRGPRPQQGIFDGPIRTIAADAGVAGLLPRLESWLAGAPEEAERFEWAERRLVPDWSGDGRPDDLSIHYMFEISDAAVRTTATLRAVEGDSGAVLWTRRWQGDDGSYVFAELARVGPKAEAGLMLTEISGIALDTTNIDYTLRALTSRGKKVWVREFHSTVVGQWPSSFVGTDYVTGMGSFDGLPGRATDYLVASGTVVAAGLDSGVIEAAVVDGRDGSLVEHPVPEVGVGFIPFAGTVGDLDRDRLDDYVFLNERPSTAPGGDGETVPVTIGNGVVAARNGADGFPLWTSGGLDFRERNVQLTDLGDFTGTKEGDVFVETMAQLLSPDNPDQYLTYLLDGSDGNVAWKVRGQWPYTPGDITGDGSNDLLLQDYYSDDGFVATRVHAYTGSGRKLWRREYRTEHPLQTCCSALFHWGGGWGAGDLDGDGLSDGYVTHSAGPIGPRRDVDVVENFVVHAASGRILAEGGREFTPLGEPGVDAVTADYVLVRWAADGLAVDVHDGRTGDLLTASRIGFDLPIDPKNLYFYAETGRLDADRCGDVVLQVEAPTGVYEVVLKGADGTLLWGQSIGRRNGVVEVTASTDSNEAC